MQSEKMMILKMLEEGKINADEASRLLAAGEGAAPRPAHSSPSVHPPSQQRPPSSTATPYPSPPPPSPHGYSSSYGSGAQPNSSKPPESAVDSMGRKFGAFVKEMEPKVKKVAGVVVEKTASAAESISKSLSSHGSKSSGGGGYSSAPSPSGQGHYSAPPRPSAPTAGGGVEEVVEIKVDQAGGELNLTGLNGQVLVKGYNGDKISAKIYTVAKRAGARAQLATLGNKYYLSFEESDFERVCIDAFVPEAMFDNIRIATTNGDISISTVTSSYVFAENINGNTEVAGVSAGQLTIEGSNGRFAIKETVANGATIENFNGAISIDRVDIANLKANTFNGTIDMQVAAFNAHDHYTWNVETSNGKLSVLLPTYATLGYHIKAHAALNDVKLGLVSMN
ncbi:MAG: DUF4097 domain-containing protein, partial [Defluviitaleaceae bacterium]|nr:DUF4097 domain-containing protein [Defluviitaleaceae bacterium]